MARGLQCSFRMPEADSCEEQIQRLVLVVESDVAVRTLIGRVLTAEGYKVWTVSHWREALDLAGRHPFKVVLLERNGIGNKGPDPLEQFRQRHPGLAAIVMTADPHQGDAALARGAAACFEKPLDFHVLLDTIGHLPVNPSDESEV